MLQWFRNQFAALSGELAVPCTCNPLQQGGNPVPRQASVGSDPDKGRWASGPVQSQAVNHVRSWRKQHSAENAMCRGAAWKEQPVGTSPGGVFVKVRVRGNSFDRRVMRMMRRFFLYFWKDQIKSYHMMKLSMRFGAKLKLKDKKDLLKLSRGYETIWLTVRKSQLKTLEDTAINSLSKLSYLRFNNWIFNWQSSGSASNTRHHVQELSW